MLIVSLLIIGKESFLVDHEIEYLAFILSILLFFG